MFFKLNRKFLLMETIFNDFLFVLTLEIRNMIDGKLLEVFRELTVDFTGK